jgi:hypothetical protein
MPSEWQAASKKSGNWYRAGKGRRNYPLITPAFAINLLLFQHQACADSKEDKDLVLTWSTPIENSPAIHCRVNENE